MEQYEKFPLVVLLVMQIWTLGCSRAPEAQTSGEATPNTSLKAQVDRQQQAIANAAAQRQKEQQPKADLSPRIVPSTSPNPEP